MNRQVRKQLKLKEPEPIIESSSSEEEEEEMPQRHNAFAMLNKDSSSSSEEDSSTDGTSSCESSPDINSPDISEKKPHKTANIEELSVDELNIILQNQDWDVVTSAPPVQPLIKKENNLLHINPKLFNFEAELNRQFGTQTRTNGKPQLIQINPNWPRFHNCGLSLQYIESNWQYVHSKQYSEIEFQFLNFFVTMDIPSLVRLNQLYPSHINTLLLISEQHRPSDVDMASDYIQRALAVLQKSINYNLLTLDYFKQENRSLFIILVKHIYYLNRKGAWQSSFEIAKFLFKINKTDPMYIGSLIDFLAIMSKQYNWLDEFIINNSDIIMCLYPNMWYTQALGWFLQDKDACSIMLLKAFHKCPCIGLALMGHGTEEIHGLLYKQMHSKLWTAEQSIQQWLNKIGNQYLDSLKTLEPPAPPASIKIKNPLYRFIILMDYDLFKYIPESKRAFAYVFDPFPPVGKGTYMAYLELQMEQRKQLFDTRAIANTTHPLAGLLQTLLPWINDVQGNEQEEEDE